MASEEHSQRPETKTQPDNLTVPLQTRDILPGAYRSDRLACHHRRRQRSRDNGRPATCILIVQGQVVEISLVNRSEEEALHEESSDHSIFEKLNYVDVSKASFGTAIELHTG